MNNYGSSYKLDSDNYFIQLPFKKDQKTELIESYSNHKCIDRPKKGFNVNYIDLLKQ